MRRARSDTKRSRFESRGWWRFPVESRAVAWILFGVVLAALMTAMALGVSISVGRRHCAEVCAERQYSFKEYVAPGRFGNKPEVCTCSKDGAPVEVPLR